MQPTRTIGIAVLTVGLLGGAPAYAESNGDQLSALTLEELMDVSVTIASLFEQPLIKAPAVATVITAADIKAMGATELDDVLEAVPGLHVSRSFDRLNSLYSIRGVHTGQNPEVLVLLDGTPVTNMFDGARPEVFRYPVANISRIEIIRGPGSALYGADAFAGVINIISKQASELSSAEVGMRLGSFGRQDVWLQHGGSWRGWDVALSLETNKSDGDDGRIVNSDVQTTFDGIYGTDASLAPGPLSTRYDQISSRIALGNRDWRISSWYWLQADAGQGAGATQSLDPVGRHREHLVLFDVHYQHPTNSDHWELGADWSYRYQKFRSYFVAFPPGAQLPIGPNGTIDPSVIPDGVTFTDGLLGNPGGDLHSLDSHFRGTYSGLQSHRLQLGAGAGGLQLDVWNTKNHGSGVIDGTVSPIDGTLTDVSGTKSAFMADQRRYLLYLYGQHEWHIVKTVALTSALRFDRYSDFGITLNPRVALVWAPVERLSTKLLYGRSFRAPALSELYFVNNPSLLGNPELGPQNIQTAELAFDYRPTTTSKVALNFFYSDIDDLVVPVRDPAPSTTIRNQNAGAQRGQGFEFEAEWRPRASLMLRANFAFQRAENKQDDSRVPDAPGQQAYADFRWNFLPGVSASTQVNWISGRKRSVTDTREEIDDYTKVDATLRWAVDDHWTFSTSVRNALNADAREPSNGAIPDDYPLEGRSIHAELSYCSD